MGKATSVDAYCLDCDLKWHDCAARRQAYDHSKSTGHRTNVQVVQSYRYGRAQQTSDTGTTDKSTD